MASVNLRERTANSLERFVLLAISVHKASPEGILAGLDVLKANNFKENGDMSLAQIGDDSLALSASLNEGELDCKVNAVDTACLTEETLSNSEQDILEGESGVESASGDGEQIDHDWSPSSTDLLELNLTAEQAQETLRYFCK